MFVLNFFIKTIKWMVVAFLASTILSVVLLRFVPVYFTPLMFIRMVQQIKDGKSITCHHHWVPLEQMSEHMPLAVMASEDQRFYQHHGFDFTAIEKAIAHNQKKGKNKHGASTISQQTAKNVFLWPDRSWLRKGLEFYFTVLIELMWSKDRIMEVYLNSIEMGDGIYGVDAVAEWHFQCTAKDLAKGQCALIAATLPNPIRYNSSRPSPYIVKRKEHILKEMKYIQMHIKEKKE
ncbi:MAG: monofunctional biosynthetic peptidoglycan transglycosylase [Prevotella sp.]